MWVGGPLLARGAALRPRCSVGRMRYTPRDYASALITDIEREPLKITINDVEHVFEPIEGGFHVKDLPDGMCVDVMKMIFNWRIVRSFGRSDAGEHMYMDRGWCYQGTGPETLLKVLLEALLWDGADNTEPGGGWIKRAC